MRSAAGTFANPPQAGEPQSRCYTQLRAPAFQTFHGLVVPLNLELILGNLERPPNVAVELLAEGKSVSNRLFAELTPNDLRLTIFRSVEDTRIC